MLSLTHGPPHLIFDLARRGNYAGCEALRAHLPRLCPRLHVFGHIHEGHGAHIHDWNTSDSTPPQVQNDGIIEGALIDLSDTEIQQSVTEYCPLDPPVGRTVFVNAATLPAGKLAWRDKQAVPIGGPGFQPVVVDLKDTDVVEYRP